MGPKLGHVSAALTTLKQVCEQWLTVSVASLRARGHDDQVWFVTWVLDSLCWLQCCLGNLVRECWVHPDEPVGGLTRRPPRAPPAPGNAAPVVILADGGGGHRVSSGSD